MKGQGISINVIIIAAIALLVLVILSVLLLKSGGTIATSTQCEEQAGGKCFSATTGCTGDYVPQTAYDQDCGTNKVCCRKLG